LHRKGPDWLFSLIGVRPARCLTCGRKFYARYKLSDDGKYVLSPSKDEAGRGEFNKIA